MGSPGGLGTAEVPRPELERTFRDPYPPPPWGKHLPATHPHLIRAGISSAPPAGLVSRKVKVKAGRGGFEVEEIAAP